MRATFSPKLEAFLRLRPGEECIPWILYHHKNFAAATALTATYRYFTVALGAQDPDTGTAASDEDTNMSTGGQLTAPLRMLVRKINVMVTPSTTDTIPVGSADNGATVSLADDIARIINRGLLTLTLLNKEYVHTSPLALTPAGMGTWGALSAATTVAATTITNALVTNGVPSSREGFEGAWALESQTSFFATVSFPKGSLTTTNAVRIGVALHGNLYRPEQ